MTREREGLTIFVTKTDTKAYDVFLKHIEHLNRFQSLTYWDLANVTRAIKSDTMESTQILETSIGDTSWSDCAGWHWEREINTLIREKLCFKDEQYFLKTYHKWWNKDEGKAPNQPTYFMWVEAQRILYVDSNDPVRIMEFDTDDEPIIKDSIPNEESLPSLSNPFKILHERDLEFVKRYLVVRRVSTK